MGPIGSAGGMTQPAANAAALAARKALAVATAVVGEDKRNHSPSCVASDQKIVDRAAVTLATADAAASKDTTPPAGSTSGTRQAAVTSAGLGLTLDLSV